VVYGLVNFDHTFRRELQSVCETDTSRYPHLETTYNTSHPSASLRSNLIRCKDVNEELREMVSELPREFTDSAKLQVDIRWPSTEACSHRSVEQFRAAQISCRKASDIALVTSRCP